MMTREHVEPGTTKRCTVTRLSEGWEVKEEHNSRLVRRTRYTDWHRVERALYAFDARAAAGSSTNR